MIITDSSVIEDLLNAFHYQQQTYNETERQKGGGGGGKRERRRRGCTERGEEESGAGRGGVRCWGRLLRDGRVSKGIRKGREMVEEEKVEVVCNRERERERESGREREKYEKAECVPTWSVWSWGKLHSTVGSRGN